MFCKRCGAQNDDGAKFCCKCGENIGEVANAQGGGVQTKSSTFNFFNYIINSIIKPVATFKEQKEELKNPKNAFILAGISSGLLMILKVIVTLIEDSRKKSVFGEISSFFGSKSSSSNYVAIVLGSLIGLFAAICIIAGVYYVIANIFKKKIDYISLVGFISASLIPIILATQVVGKLLGLLSGHFQIVLIIIAWIYTIAVIAVGVNEVVKLEKPDQTVFFHLACGSINFIVIYIVLYNFLLNVTSSSITKSLF